MLVAVRQHGQEAGAFDSGVDLALEDRARAGQACWDDLAVLAHEVTQGVDVFVVDFFNASSGKAAKALALEQQGLCVALGALVFVETFWSGHDGLLKLNNLFDGLNMKDDAFAGACVDQKTGKHLELA